MMNGAVLSECVGFVKAYTDVSLSEAAAFSCLNEAEIANISNEVIEALYKTALDKYRKVDFGDIPKSKGDFTKLTEYKTIMESIQLLESIKAKVSVKSLTELDTIKKAISNLERYKREFELSYKTDREIGQMLYETISLAAVQATSFLIAVAVEFIKVPGQEYDASFNNVINKRGTEFNIILMRNLENFNQACDKGQVTKFFNTILATQAFVGVETVTALLIGVGIAICIVPIMRELIYQFFNTTMKLSKFFEVQAKFVEANTNRLRMDSSARTVKDRQKVISEQEKLIKNFYQVSTSLRGCVELADKNAKIDLKSKQSYKKVSQPKTDLNNTNNNNTGGGSTSDLQLL